MHSTDLTLSAMSFRLLSNIVDKMVELFLARKCNGFYFYGTSVLRYIAAFDLAMKIDEFVYDATNGLTNYDNERILLFRLEDSPNDKARDAYELMNANRNLVIILIGDLPPCLELCTTYAAYVLKSCKVFEMNGI